MSKNPANLSNIRIVSLYEDVLNVYADRGNRQAIEARASEVGIATEIVQVSIGDQLPEEADLVLIGGGQDREQGLVAGDLRSKGPALRDWSTKQVAMLAVCGGFQLFCNWFRDNEGRLLEGIGIFDAVSVVPESLQYRMVGDVVLESRLDGFDTVVGYENHSGQTFLGADTIPFGRVLQGYGNNGYDSTEGAISNACIGTYLHGPVLPKNVDLLYWLLNKAFAHRVGQNKTLVNRSSSSPLEKASLLTRRSIVERAGLQ